MNFTFPLARPLLAAALIIAVSAALAWLAPTYISTELSRRLLGVLLGAVVVAYANVVPKALASHARLRCSPAQEQAARRFAGWSLVLGGIGYMLAWLFAPIAMANLVAGVLLAIGLLFAVVRYLRLGGSGQRR